ncbi:DUF1353 domain-containing protein [Desulfarculus baarsii]|uniref:DUF1353 domain-containing protein n=1 Tax=Desulfarculus baarsii TaxID=453230 RepID=UPI0002F5A55F|nr:DUF1353 domain-containing protein [Desulfarculus baarsii]
MGGVASGKASVPRLLWSLLSPTGVLIKGAVAHDYLHSQIGQKRGWGSFISYPIIYIPFVDTK